jgi:hypothetical protein
LAAKFLSLNDFKVNSYAEVDGKSVMAISFKNFNTKTSHKGEIKLDLKAEDVDRKKDLITQLSAVPEVAEETESVTTPAFKVTDIRYVKQGEFVNVVSGSFGLIASFVAKSFNEENKEKIEKIIEAKMREVSGYSGMNLSYVLPIIASVSPETVVAPVKQTVPKDAVASWFTPTRVSKEDDDIIKRQSALATDEQRAKFNETISNLQSFAENQTRKVLMSIRGLDAIRMVSARKSPEISLDANQKFNGTVYVTATLGHDNDFKTVTFSIALKESVLSLDKASMIAAIKNTKGEIAKAEKQEAVEARSMVASIVTKPQVSTAPITKVASPSTVDHGGYACVLKINKAQFPESLKVGDIINVDGMQYRIVDGNEGKLSSAGTGVYWTLQKVTDEVKDLDKVLSPAY